MTKRTHNSHELFELKWNNYSHSITEEIYNLRQNDLLVDLSFCCEGVAIGCHKLLIFACSPVLRKVITENPSPHPIIYITDIKLHILQALLRYIYQGEVQISKSDLASFMKAANSFQIRGLQSQSLLELQNRTDLKKQKTLDTGPSTSSSSNDPIQLLPHTDAGNIDDLEFESESLFDEGNESIDDSILSTSENTSMQQTSEIQYKQKQQRKPSVVWSAYTINEAQTHAICKLCQRQISITHVKPLSNLLRHLKRKEGHAIWYEELRNAMSSSVPEIRTDSIISFEDIKIEPINQ